MPRVKFLKRGASGYCKFARHAECRGKRLAPGIGPVEIIPCGCGCHLSRAAGSVSERETT